MAKYSTNRVLSVDSDVPVLKYAMEHTDSQDLSSHRQINIVAHSPFLKTQIVQFDIDNSPTIEVIKQKWVGVVTCVDGEDIHALLEDVTNPNNPNEQVVFAREEIDPHEHSMIDVGAVFYWHIGYREGEKSPRQRFSKIRFRRLPRWTAGEIELAAKEAREYASFFAES